MSEHIPTERPESQIVPVFEHVGSPEEPRLHEKYRSFLKKVQDRLSPQEIREFVELNSEQENQERMRLSDDLTGLLNRRGFREEMQRIQALFSREKLETNSAILAIDLDGFKEVNDTCGHACGDRCLMLIAEHVRDTLRESDVFARVGGDEFGIFLPKDDGAGAALVAQRVRSIIEGVVTESLRSEFPSYAGSLSASIGVANIGKNEGDLNANHTAIENAMRYADYASYVVKAAGKKGELTVAEAKEIDVDGRFEKDFLSGKTLPR